MVSIDRLVLAGPPSAAPSHRLSSAGHKFRHKQAAGGRRGYHPCASELGLLGVLGTYQQTLSGVSSHVTVAQPLIFFNLPHGYYLRSSAAMTFNTGNHTSAIPVGVGLGKVIQLDAGYTLNAYAEVQRSLYRSGVGAPNY